MSEERGFDETELKYMHIGASNLKDRARIERSEKIYFWKAARAGQKQGAKRAADRKAGIPAPRTPEDRKPYREMEAKTSTISSILENELDNQSRERSVSKSNVRPLISELLAAETRGRARGAILPPPHPRSLSERAKSSPKAARDSARASALEGMKKARGANAPKAGKGIAGHALHIPENDLHSTDSIDRMNRQWNRIRAIVPGELPDLD